MLIPAAKDYLWGGNRLNDDFGKGIDLSPLAETWECSTHPDGPSIIANGRYRGQKLTDVLKKTPELLGKHSMALGELPILIKFIDAKQDLSIQVHPDNAYALEHEGEYGKTEAWYVVDAEPGASLVYGFDKLIEQRTGINTRVADDAIKCVAEGTGKSLEWVSSLQDGTINLSRRKQMN